MDSSIQRIFTASVTGSIELFLLVAVGARLAHMDILNRFVSRALSRAVLNFFLPALLFRSIVHTLHSMNEKENPNLFIFAPPLVAIFTQSLGLLLGLGIMKLFGANLEPMVRRACVLCVCFGNANTLPIMVLQTLCESFKPLADSAGGVTLCKEKSAGISALFLVIWSSAFWSVGLRYLVGNDVKANEANLDLSDCEATEEQSTLIYSSDDNQPNGTAPKVTGRGPTKIPGLLTPPVVAIFIALLIGYTPKLSTIFVTSRGPIQSLNITLKLLGHLVVPTSSMIVGAKLWAHYTDPSEAPIGTSIVVAVVFGRLVLVPGIGLVTYLFARNTFPIGDPLLHLAMLGELNVPTANNNMVVAQIASLYRPDEGRSAESTVATLIFWQYLFLAIFQSAYTAAFLGVIFGTTAQVSAKPL